MQITVPAGKYVVAVSGGVDSVTLLDLLAQEAKKPDSNLKLLVAHFDHGIRSDSAEDRKLVQKLAAKHKLPFVFDQASLGAGTSEAVARKARYSFLYRVSDVFGADAIITAHHQDDLLETVIINLLRGTKSRGLSSLRSTTKLRRPLLKFTKRQIHAYAVAHNLTWREDSTNEDEAYLRNYIRRHIMPKLSLNAREKLLGHSEKAAMLNDAIHGLTNEYLRAQPDKNTIDRDAFRRLPQEVKYELLAEWLRQQADVTITSKLIHRLSDAIDTGRTSAQFDVARGYRITLTKTRAKLEAPE